jgi:predicted transcriptional regulator
MKIYIAELFRVEIQFQQGGWKLSYKFDDLNELDNHYETILNNMIKRLEDYSHTPM